MFNQIKVMKLVKSLFKKIYHAYMNGVNSIYVNPYIRH